MALLFLPQGLAQKTRRGSARDACSLRLDGDPLVQRGAPAPEQEGSGRGLWAQPTEWTLAHDLLCPQALDTRPDVRALPPALWETS